MRQKLGWQGAFILLSTRSWEPVYGTDTLIEGFVQAAERDSDLRLLMLGDGSLRPKIVATLEAAGLTDRVHFGGQVDYDSMPAIFRAGNAYVSASHSDGTSISLLEAMACGLPSVVSDIPGNREWVMPGENGWLFSDGDPRDLAEAILMAKTDSQARTMGGRARAKAEERADWRRNFQLLLEAYRMALVGLGAER